MDARPDEIAGRLAAHVATIVGNGRVPAADREDVAEELRGHLSEAYGAAIEQGLPPDEAADRALEAFGGAELLSRELMVTYQGRLWASTIGQLLPVTSRAGEPPWPIGWIANFDRLIALLSVLGAGSFLLTATPVRAVLGSVLGIGAAVAIWLAATGLRRGQHWAVTASTYVCVINAVVFFGWLAPPGGGVNISLTGLAGLVLLFGLGSNLTPVEAWVAGSPPIPNRLGWLVAVTLVGWSVVALAGGNVPDPTQIGPSDIRATATVTCGVPSGKPESGAPLVPVPTVDLHVTYDRVDAWPRGILREPTSWGDTIQLDLGPFYAPPGDVRATSTSADGTVEPVDLTVWSDVPDDLSSIDGQRTIVGQILGTDQRAGGTIRVVIPTVSIIEDGRPPDEVGTPLGGMVATVRLRHLDRFSLVGYAECDRTFQLEPTD